MIHLSSRKKQKNKTAHMNTSSSGRKMCLSSFNSVGSVVIEPTNIIWINNIKEINDIIKFDGCDINTNDDGILITIPKNFTTQSKISFVKTNTSYVSLNLVSKLEGISISSTFSSVHKNIESSYSYSIERIGEKINQKILGTDNIVLNSKLVNNGSNTIRMEFITSTKGIKAGTINNNSVAVISIKEIDEAFLNIYKLTITLENRNGVDKNVLLTSPFILLS